jgi:hypothetical protein
MCAEHNKMASMKTKKKAAIYVFQEFKINY